jgi:glycosyltransferase involved in cell wall biosynthesis
MRLLYTLPDFWPHVLRGSERIVHDLAATMASSGNDVTVLTRGISNARSRAPMDGFTVDYRPRRNLARPLGWSGEEGFAVTAAVAAGSRSADIYHSFYLTDAYGVSAAAKLRRRPFVLSWHGMPEREWWEENHPRTYRWVVKAMRRAARVTVMTEACAREIRHSYGVEPVVMAPGLFTADYSLERKLGARRTIVCLAALDDGRKRLELLIAAFAILARDLPDIDLLLLGHGWDGDVARWVAATPPEIATRITWRGVAPAEVPGVLAGCAVAALTSLEEAFGMAVVEALASGIPVVVSDDGGSPEVISEGTGLSFRSGDTRACADALDAALKLAADPGTEARCRARAQGFDWSVRGPAYLGLYRELT